MVQTPNAARPTELVYDWNEVERKGRVIPKHVTFFD